MNSAHLHLIVVHLPIVLVPLGALLFLLSVWRHQSVLRNVALSLFIAGACFSGIAFISGGEAEELVEHVAGVVESNIEEHEEAADIALWLTVALGVVSLLGLNSHRLNPKAAGFLTPVIVLLAITSSGTLAYTGNLGGQIKHPEAFATSTTNVDVSLGGSKRGDHDD